MELQREASYWVVSLHQLGEALSQAGNPDVLEFLSDAVEDGMVVPEAVDVEEIRAEIDGTGV